MGLTDELSPFLQDIEKAALSDDTSEIPAKFNHVKKVSTEAVKEIENLLQDI
jgi:hypothetical protein